MDGKSIPSSAAATLKHQTSACRHHNQLETRSYLPTKALSQRFGSAGMSGR